MRQDNSIFNKRINFKPVGFSGLMIGEMTWEARRQRTYATTKDSSSGLRNRILRACLTLLGRCIGAMYAIVLPLTVTKWPTWCGGGMSDEVQIPVSPCGS